MAIETVKVGSQVKKKLDEKKRVEGHTSLDSVIRGLFLESELYRQAKARIEDLERENKRLRK